MSEPDRLARVTRWLWLVPLGLGALLFTTPGVKLGPDGAWYMALGLNIQNGLGYVNWA